MTNHDLLTKTINDIEAELATLGWDQAPALFALVSHEWLADNLPDKDHANPEEKDLLSAVESDPTGVTAVLQETDPQADIDSLLRSIVFPDSVTGVALSMERIILPDEALDALPTDPDERDKALADHPQRDDIRVVAGVNRDGDSWCTIRTRSHDNADDVLRGDRLVPDVVDALTLTLIPEDDSVSSTERTHSDSSMKPDSSAQSGSSSSSDATSPDDDAPSAKAH